MKKFKNKGVMKIGVIISLIICCTILSPSMVNAQKTYTCNIFDGTAIAANLNQNDVTFTLHAKSGKWKYGYIIGTMNDDEDRDDGLNYNDIMNSEGLITDNFTKGGTFDASEGDFTFTIKRSSNYNKEIIVLMWLVDSDIKGCSGKNALKGKKSFKLKGKGQNVVLDGNSAIKTTTIPIKQSKSTRNQSSNAQCQAIGAAKYYKDGRESEFDLSGNDKNEYVNMMSQKFKYCFGSYNASFNLANDAIKNVRHASLKAFKSYLDFKEEASKHSGADYQNALKEAQENGYTPVNNTSLSTLSCNKKSTTEETKKYYYEKEVVSNNVCSVKCIEQFQVTYDPPVAVKAGLCFQYKVTVRSKVTCKTEIKPSFSWPEAPTPEVTCDYIPVCQNSHSSTQAGPNDDFDECVNSCDGGKYTQKCINSCYSKVYENNKENANSLKQTGTYDNNVSVQQLAGHSKDPYYNVPGCKTNGQIISNHAQCGAAFSELKQQYPMGYYKKNNEGGSESWIQYDWRPCFDASNKHCQYTDDDGKKLNYSIEKYNGNLADSDFYKNNNSKSYIEAIKRAAPYYLRTASAADLLIRSFRGDGTLPNRWYIIGNAGIKRQKSSRWQCHEVCGFLANNSYGGCNASLSSSKDIEDDYVKKLNKIEEEFAACTTNAVCKEDKATFYIDVTDKKTYSGKDKESWTATNRSSSKSTTPQTGGDTSMFVPLECTEEQKKATPLVCDVENVEQAPGINGQCYGRDNPKYWQHYKTTITFPGTWINLKSAERVYKEPNSSSLNNYREKKNYYCTGYDSEDVNVDWWNWKVNGKGNVNSITLEKDNNITANIANFGKFDWSVGLKCFFGLYTKTCDPSSGDPECNFPEEEDQCSGENSTAICNYKFRVIDQQNMFPDEEGQKGNRERGFNWTTKAIDNTIPKDSTYFIDPEKYWQQLEASANTAFPSSDAEFSNADYRIKLTLDNIKNIRAYVKKNNFNTFDGTYHKVTPEVEGLYYYRSGLRNNTSLVSSWTGDLAGKNNN